MTALCPDTLREVLSAVEQYSERVAGGTTSRRAAQRGVIAACKDIAATLRTALDAAASEPPRLSAWIAACEGTGLGEPLTWWDDGLDGLNLAEQWFVNGEAVVAYCGPNGDCHYVEVEGQVRQRCATPAELRAALERLAQEAQR